MVSEMKIFKVFPIINLWEVMTPRAWPVYTQGLDWQDVHTKYISCEPHGFREEDFLSFSYYKSMGVMTPGAEPI